MNKHTSRTIHFAIFSLVLSIVGCDGGSDAPTNDGSSGSDGTSGADVGADTGADAAESKDAQETQSDVASRADTTGAEQPDSTDVNSSDAAAEPTDTSSEDVASEDDVVAGVAEYRSLTTTELEDWLSADAKDFVLINVHIPYEGEIPGTDLHVPFNNVAQLVQALDNDLGKKAVLYCKTGPMSYTAVNDLVDLGFYNLWDYADAMIGWKAAGNPLDNATF